MAAFPRWARKSRRTIIFGIARPQECRDSSARSSRMETRFLHRCPSFGVSHERVPDKAGAFILRHHHRDAEINSQDVLVIPSVQRIERIDEAVARPSLFFVAAADIAENAHAIVINKRKRAP